MLYNIEVVLACIVIPTHCMKSVLAHRSSTPFKQKLGMSVYLPHPCLNSCYFCQDEYDSITPTIIRVGVWIILMDLFSGDNRISGDITFVPVLLDNIKKYSGCNQLVFGLNSKKEPKPIMVKNVVDVNSCRDILSHSNGRNKYR